MGLVTHNTCRGFSHETLDRIESGIVYARGSTVHVLYGSRNKGQCRFPNLYLEKRVRNYTLKRNRKIQLVKR